MTFATMQGRFQKFMLTVDTIEMPLTTAEQDALINEALIEYYARFGSVFVYGADSLGVSSNVVTLGGFTGQVIEIEQVELKSGASYIPLKRATPGQLLFLAASEGATGPPEEYAVSLQAQSLSLNSTEVLLIVYPIPDASYTVRARGRVHLLDLVAAGDIPPIDDPQADQVCRIAAGRAGLTLGYPREWFDALYAPLPNQIRKELQVDDRARSSASSEPIRVGETVDGI